MTFCVRAGEVLGLIGPNGSGKTTLLECIAGLQPVDRGAVTLDERPLDPGVGKHHVFYMPDGIRPGIRPWPDQRLDWALRFFRGLYGRSARESISVAGELGLASVMMSRMGALSKSEMNRALLSLALLTAHPMLLLDEPFDGPLPVRPRGAG